MGYWSRCRASISQGNAVVVRDFIDWEGIGVVDGYSGNEEECTEETHG